MTFQDWIFSEYPEGTSINGAWKPLHIAVLILTIAVAVALGMIFSKKQEKHRKTVIKVLALALLFFELTRRIINIIKGNCVDFTSTMGTILPRPWCAISVWFIILAPFINKKFWYNITSAMALLNTVIFFAYPDAGFNRSVILFENVYSIGTHCLLLISAITLITLHFTDYTYKRPDWKGGAWRELIALLAVFAYAFIEIYLLKIEADPLYFLPGNGVLKVIPMPYPVYLIVYCVFMLVWFNSFYFVQWFARKRKAKKETDK